MTRTASPSSLGDSYIEVDFDNQQMTFIKDGRLVVNTNIVTGALNGHQTPTGLYETHGKEHDVWLKGDDYLVFVKYWVSVVGDIIGLARRIVAVELRRKLLCLRRLPRLRQHAGAGHGPDLEPGRGRNARSHARRQRVV